MGRAFGRHAIDFPRGGVPPERQTDRARRVDQLGDTPAAVEVMLDAEERKLFDEASKLRAEYPGWMTEMWSKAHSRSRNSDGSAAGVASKLG